MKSKTWDPEEKCCNPPYQDYLNCWCVGPTLSKLFHALSGPVLSSDTEQGGAKMRSHICALPKSSTYNCNQCHISPTWIMYLKMHMTCDHDHVDRGHPSNMGQIPELAGREETGGWGPRLGTKSQIYPFLSLPEHLAKIWLGMLAETHSPVIHSDKTEVHMVTKKNIHSSKIALLFFAGKISNSTKHSLF